MSISRPFVTGASGFLGSYVVRALVARGMKVAVLLRGEEMPERLLGFEDKIHVVRGDLMAADGWMSAAQVFAPDAIVHMAWLGVSGDSRNDPAQADNIPATLRLAALAHGWGVKHFIGAGSQAEYGPLNRICAETDPTEPSTLYGHAKLAACRMTEAFCAVQNMRFAWLRIFSTYGPGDHESWMIPSLINQLLAGQSPALTRGEQKWDFLHARDAAEAFAAVLMQEEARGIFNLGSGQAPSLAATIETIRDFVNPLLPLGFGEIPYRPDQVMHLQSNIARLRKLTGWAPSILLKDGLQETVAWYAEKFAQRRHVA